jgi:AcrR family transcriptional regulator
VTPRRRRRPAARPYHHGDLPRALLDEALSMIRAVGPAAVTLREVAARVGVSHAAPYRHFPSRRALLTAVAVDGMGELARRIEEALAAARPQDVRTRFLAAGAAYVRFALDEPAYFQVMSSRDEIDVDDPRVAEAKTKSFGILLRFIEEAQRAGEFVAGEPLVLATPIWALHHGLACLAAEGAFAERGGRGNPRMLRRLVDDAHARLLDGLFPRAPAPKRAKRAKTVTARR